MKKLKYFLDCYFHFNADFTELDELIEDFKKESSSSQLEFIYELREIIDTKNYAKAARIIKRYGERTFDFDESVSEMKGNCCCLVPFELFSVCTV